MSFIHHNYLGELELDKKETNGMRLYNLPNGEWVPSITSVTSHYNRQLFVDWRKKIGEEKANQITRQATARGTDFHLICQDYLENKEINWENYQPASRYMFHSIKPELDKINNIHAIERTLYSEYLGIAGRVDCIAEYEGELAIIDFKTAGKIKPEDWIQQYFVQEVAYACMYYELTEIPVKKLITLMVTPDGEFKVFDKRDKDHYIKLLVKYIKEFVKETTRQ
jgi:genome maintenance exonuclease 1